MVVCWEGLSPLLERLTGHLCRRRRRLARLLGGGRRAGVLPLRHAPPVAQAVHNPLLVDDLYPVLPA